MKKWPALALLISGMISTGAYALDLTPHEITSSVEGPAVQRYFFQDQSKRLGFRIDNQMTVSGGVNSVTFRFRDIKTGGVKLSNSPLQASVPFDEKNAEAYRTAAQSFLPPDSTNAQLEEEISDPITINGWTSHRYVFNYTLFGAPYHGTVTFINFSPEEQLVFDVNAALPEYEKSYARGYRVLNSLGEWRATDPTGPT